MEKSVYDVTDKIIHQQQGLTTSESIDVEGMFVVKLLALKQENNFLILICLWMNQTMILIINSVLLSTSKRSGNYMIVVGRMFLIYLLMWLCLVMDAVCLCILSFITRKSIHFTCYHVRISDHLMEIVLI